LAKHESLPFMAVVGLDRMLRIYDTNSRKQVNCMYLKQRVNCVLMGRDGTWGVDGEDYNNSDVEQDDIVRDYVDSDHENGDDQSFAEEESIDQANHTDDSENDAKDDSASGSSDSGDHQDDDSDDNKSQNEEPTINPRKRVKR
jgi:ribosome biogenesis protein NSA1